MTPTRLTDLLPLLCRHLVARPYRGHLSREGAVAAAERWIDPCECCPRPLAILRNGMWAGSTYRVVLKAAAGLNTMPGWAWQRVRKWGSVCAEVGVGNPREGAIAYEDHRRSRQSMHCFFLFRDASLLKSRLLFPRESRLKK